METQFIVRLLDQDRHVLGWTKIPAETKGDGGLWAKQQFVAEADTTGIGVAVCFHWPDLHWYATTPLPNPQPVEAGKVFTIAIMGVPMLRVPSEALPLPGVTVKNSVTIGIGSAKPI